MMNITITVVVVATVPDDTNLEGISTTNVELSTDQGTKVNVLHHYTDTVIEDEDEN